MFSVSDALYQPHTITAGVFIIGVVYTFVMHDRSISDVDRMKLTFALAWLFGLFYFAVRFIPTVVGVLLDLALMETRCRCIAAITC
jgi:hypothetical protein